MNPMTTPLRQLLITLTLASLLVGCYSPGGRPDYTANGALIGGASGAAIGALADRRSPGAGALIGGAAGLITGGLIGHSMDRQAEARNYSPPPPPPYTAVAPELPPSLADIEAMSRSGVADDLIIAQINRTGAVYRLDANAIIGLSQAGVSQKVIAYMINTASTVVTEAPPPVPTETLVVCPGPDYVWVGGEWAWNGAAWVWVGGRWVLPPYHHAVWVEARWVHGPHGWYREGGRWR